jgi:oxygen-independent coproporphyrinogen-3 oxidase
VYAALAVLFGSSGPPRIFDVAAGIYLHIPFCKSRCSYCDFATDVYRDSAAVERYVEALCREGSTACVGGWQAQAVTLDGRDFAGGTARLQIDTIYFGGGTPSLLNPDQVGRILQVVHDRFNVAADAEITMEMNPATVTAESLTAYRSLGVNRASFGVQTFNDRDLKLLARGHDVHDARNTFRLLREAGFDNVSFDLIAGLPGQTMADWQFNLEEAIKLDPEHISLYLLEIHEGTPLATQLRSGRRPMPDDEESAQMYEVMLDRLATAGFAQYEISNFAKPGFEARHNTKYWRLDPVYGFGVSAHSFDGAERYANDRDTNAYVRKIESGETLEVFREPTDVASEFLFLGLRLERGIDLRAYERRFGIDVLAKYDRDLLDLQKAGLVEIDEDKLRLTRKGKLFSNEVFAVFV